MPQWLEKIEKYGSLPFLYLHLDDATLDELREIAQEFMKAQPGLYFLTSRNEDRTLYYAALQQNLTAHFDLKSFALWLKEQGLQGGGTATSLQGSGPSIDLSLEYDIKQWIHENVR